MLRPMLSYTRSLTASCSTSLLQGTSLTRVEAWLTKGIEITEAFFPEPKPANFIGNKFNSNDIRELCTWTWT